MHFFSSLTNEISCCWSFLQCWEVNVPLIVYGGSKSALVECLKIPASCWKYIQHTGTHLSGCDLWVYFFIYTKFAVIPVISNHIHPHSYGYLESVFDWNISGVIGLVCHLLLIIRNSWIWHKKLTNSLYLAICFRSSCCSNFQVICLARTWEETYGYCLCPALLFLRVLFHKQKRAH